MRETREGPGGAASRQSNVELLRLAAMLMIVFSHFSAHSGFLFPDGGATVNRLWLHTIKGGNVGLDLFLLISGYFLITAERFHTLRLLKLWFQILTYSLVLYGIFVLTGAAPLTYLYVLVRCLPVAYNQWWFASMYLPLFLLSPLLNRLLTGLDKGSYRMLLAVTGVLWSAVPTLLPYVNYQCNDLLWGVYLYALAGYLRLHADTARLSRRRCFLLTGLLLVLMVLFSAFCDLMGARFPLLEACARSINDKQSLPILLMALLLFLGVLKLDIGRHRWINVLASATFGVYLLHDDAFVRPFLWEQLFHGAAYVDSPLLIPYSIAVCLAVFLCATAIELLRLFLVERPCLPLLRRMAEALERWVRKHFS